LRPPAKSALLFFLRRALKERKQTTTGKREHSEKTYECLPGRRTPQRLPLLLPLAAELSAGPDSVPPRAGPASLLPAWLYLGASSHARTASGEPADRSSKVIIGFPAGCADSRGSSEKSEKFHPDGFVLVEHRDDVTVRLRVSQLEYICPRGQDLPGDFDRPAR
jgi:hypothetical protein